MNRMQYFLVHLLREKFQKVRHQKYSSSKGDEISNQLEEWFTEMKAEKNSTRNKNENDHNNINILRL